MKRKPKRRSLCSYLKYVLKYGRTLERRAMRDVISGFYREVYRRHRKAPLKNS